MLILASKSPRRRELLSIITKDFTVKSAEVDESLPDGISPKEAVEYLSRIKAEPFRSEEDLVIGADTVVAVQGKILGKPESDAQAKEMLSLLSGKTHSVFTGVTLIKGDRSITFSEETRVTFYELSEDEITDYIRTGEPSDKAGAYGIQGRGCLLVKGIEGDYFNVVGLPVGKLHKFIQKFS